MPPSPPNCCCGGCLVGSAPNMEDAWAWDGPAAAGAGLILGPNRARMELLDNLPSGTAWAELSCAGLVSVTLEVGA